MARGLPEPRGVDELSPAWADVREYIVAVYGSFRLRHSNQVCAVDFSPDGKLIASGGFDGVVRIWDAATGQERRRIKADRIHGTALKFDPSGRYLIWGGYDGELVVWDIERNKEQWRHDIGRSYVTSVVMSPDGQWFIARADLGKLGLWRFHDGKPAFEGELPVRGPRAAAFSYDGRLAALAGEALILCDTTTWKQQRTIRAAGFPDRFSEPVAFSPDGKRIVLKRSTLVVVDIESGKEQMSLEFDGFHSPNAAAVTFTPDGKHILTVSSLDDAIVVWNAETGKAVRALCRGKPAYAHNLNDVACSPNGERVASAGTDHAVSVWDVESGKERIPSGGHRGAIVAVTLTSDHGLVTASDDRTVRMWPARRRGRIQEARTSRDWLYGHVALDQEGEHIAALEEDEGPGWPDIVVAQLPSLKSAHYCWDCDEPVILSHDGRLLAHGKRPRTPENYGVEVTDLMTGKRKAFLFSKGWSPCCGAFSADKRLLIAQGNTASVFIWDIDSEKRIGKRNIGEGTINGIACSPVGAMVAIVHRDGVVTVWDQMVQKCYFKVRLPVEPRSVCFSCDGTKLAVGTGATAAVVLQLPKRAE